MSKKKAAARKSAARKTAHTESSSRRGLQPPVEEVAVSRIAAPGRRHQPVKESGLGTPSADARPGASSLMGAFDLDTEAADLEALNERARRRTQGRMKVQATRVGYYDEKRRRPGDVFYISGETLEEDVTRDVVDQRGNVVRKEVVRRKGEIAAFSPNWMRRVPEKTPLSGSTPNDAIRQQHDQILSRMQAGELVNAGQGPVDAATGEDAENPLDAD